MIFGIERSVAGVRHWATMPGRIQSAHVKAFETRPGDRSRGVPHYRPNVTCGCEVKGVRDAGDKTGAAAQVSSNIRAVDAARLRR